MNITILLTFLIHPGEAKLPVRVCIWWDAHLHPELPGSDDSASILIAMSIFGLSFKE